MDQKVKSQYLTTLFIKVVIICSLIVPLPLQTALAKRKSYWLEGGIAGGVLVGTVTGVTIGVWEGICKTSGGCHGEGSVALSIVSATAMGFATGALIGLLFKKKEQDASISSVSPEIFADPNQGNLGLGVRAQFH